MTPPDDSGVLSQSAIDDLMAQNAGQAGTPAVQPPLAPAAQPDVPAPAPPPPPAPAPAAQPDVPAQVPSPMPQQAPPPPAVAADPGPTPAAPATAAGPDNAALAAILQRLQSLEAAVANISQSQDTNVQLQTQVRVSELTNRVQALNKHLDEIVYHLPNTMGYRAHETFQCGSCGTQGLVAVPVMCTHCRQQTWLGWWPQT